MPFGVQPTNLARFVASANTAATAASIAVWYCSTPVCDVTTVDAPIEAKFPFQLSGSSTLTSVSTPNTSRTAL